MKSGLKHYRLALLGTCVALSVADSALAAPIETVLYRFTGRGDGGFPSAALAIDSTGALYGVTLSGGDLSVTVNDYYVGAGLVFRLVPPTAGQVEWHLHALHTFGPSDHGWVPMGIYRNPTTGMIYGTTEFGGRGLWAKRGGFGNAYSLTPTSAESNTYGFSELYRFGDPSIDASSPGSPPIMDSTGALYAMSGHGVGPNLGYGTVFKLTPSGVAGGLWSDSVIYAFDANEFTPTNDASTSIRLLSTPSGSLFAVVGYSGTENAREGAIYQFTPPSGGHTQWTKNVIYAFGGIPYDDGSIPDGPLIADANGDLYGTTVGGGACATSLNFGCGIVYKLTPPTGDQTVWTETILYSFQGGSDGANPEGSIAMDQSGAIYGTTQFGGSPANDGYGWGTVFKLTPPSSGSTSWTKTVLHAFNGGTDGVEPIGGVILGSDGTLYGSAPAGGIPSNGSGDEGYGIIFKITQ